MRKVVFALAALSLLVTSIPAKAAFCQTTCQTYGNQRTCQTFCN